VSDTIMGLTRGVATKLADRVGAAASGPSTGEPRGA